MQLQLACLPCMQDGPKMLGSQGLQQEAAWQPESWCGSPQLLCMPGVTSTCSNSSSLSWLQTAAHLKRHGHVGHQVRRVRLGRQRLLVLLPRRWAWLRPRLVPSRCGMMHWLRASQRSQGSTVGRLHGRLLLGVGVAPAQLGCHRLHQKGHIRVSTVRPARAGEPAQCPWYFIFTSLREESQQP